MNKTRGWCSFTISIILLSSNIGFSNAGSPHHSTHKSASVKQEASSPERYPLTLPQSAQEGLKLTMREHLEAIKAIVGALAYEDFTKAAKVAHEELGFSKHHLAMQREEGATFPPAYHELAIAHHEAAETLGEVILTKDFKQILRQLDFTIHACVKCHQAFRIQNR